MLLERFSQCVARCQLECVHVERVKAGSGEHVEAVGHDEFVNVR